MNEAVLLAANTNQPKVALKVCLLVIRLHPCAMHECARQPMRPSLPWPTAAMCSRPRRPCCWRASSCGTPVSYACGFPVAALPSCALSVAVWPCKSHHGLDAHGWIPTCVATPLLLALERESAACKCSMRHVQRAAGQRSDLCRLSVQPTMLLWSRGRGNFWQSCPPGPCWAQDEHLSRCQSSSCSSSVSHAQVQGVPPKP